jgi:hypothetical protein
MSKRGEVHPRGGTTQAFAVLAEQMRLGAYKRCGKFNARFYFMFGVLGYTQPCHATV